jgi:hypothetical protein
MHWMLQTCSNYQYYRYNDWHYDHLYLHHFSVVELNVKNWFELNKERYLQRKKIFLIDYPFIFISLSSDYEDLSFDNMLHVQTTSENKNHRPEKSSLFHLQIKIYILNHSCVPINDRYSIRIQ